MRDSFGTRSRLDVDGRSLHYFSLPRLEARFGSLARLPYSMKILLENLLRHEDGVSVLPEHIEAVALCTKCRPDLFYSYRRDQANAGRMISVIGFSRTSLASASEPASSSPSA